MRQAVTRVVVRGDRPIIGIGATIEVEASDHAGNQPSQTIYRFGDLPKPIRVALLDWMERG